MLQWDWTYDICESGAILYQLSYKPNSLGMLLIEGFLFSGVLVYYLRLLHCRLCIFCNIYIPHTFKFQAFFFSIKIVQRDWRLWIYHSRGWNNNLNFRLLPWNLMGVQFEYVLKHVTLISLKFSTENRLSQNS